jgi:Na+/alanine symporter
MFSVMRDSTKAEHGGISSLAAFSTSLAARVGAGNIAGVAVAISLGGPGAVFWMRVVAIVGMVTSMVESTLAQNSDSLPDHRALHGRLRGAAGGAADLGGWRTCPWA